MLKTGLKAFRAALCLLLAQAVLPVSSSLAAPGDQSSAAVFVYDRIADDGDGQPAVSPQQFRDQVREFLAGGYTVLPLPDIVAALKTGRTLPPHAIGITFDSADAETVSFAAPLLLKAGLPFTIFIAPDEIARHAKGIADWPQIETLAQNRLVTIGLHSAGPFVPVRTLSETDMQRGINAAKASYRAELHAEPFLFAYPPGEYDALYRRAVEASGFTAAFGRQAGAEWAGSDMMALPRFNAASLNGDLDRFRTMANALPFPVSGIAPPDPLLDSDLPSIGFTADPSLRPLLSSLSCFMDDEPEPQIQIIGETRVEIRFKQPLDSGQTTLTCTLPDTMDTDDSPPRWRWFGMTLLPP